ncbi:MAG: hypothetical protein KKC99_00700, partial [Proteobacteria bacterium]|nr:hypothetical protein [Pseudomonadota bacterium]
MSGKVNKIDYILAVMDQFTRPLKAFNDRVDDIVRPVKRVQHSLAAMGREAGFKRIAKQVDLVHKRLGGVLSLAGKVSGALAGVSAVAGWAVKTQLLDPAAQFETFLATLEQLEGGLVPAKKSMDWISNFAAKTPYELTQVTDSFVKLRAYGLDPTSGLLRTLGDTASSMGKDVMEAVEAIADAITGENERLKEFGIKASMAGGKITYEYTDKLGKQLTKTVDKSNRAMIQATLEGIWNEKYGGAMQKRMKTWDGMWSNMMDVLNRFRLKIMEFGAFDWMREKLAGVLATIEKMDKSGELDRWAKLIGERIVT